MNNDNITPTAATVLQYWFGDNDADFQTRARLWFGGIAADDEEMRQRFGDLIHRALGGGLEEWRQSPDGLMAYILLLDQMTRATFRGTAAAFAGDVLALAACKTAMKTKMDLQLPPLHCRFFYLPLEHSENMDDQQECVAAFVRLQTRFPNLQQEFVDSVKYARQHLEIIEQFGRFPHRNAILGRQSSTAEDNFLRNGGPSFGQSAADKN